jgi:hypothetical protein
MQVWNTTELMIREEQNITAYDLNVYYYLKDTRITYEWLQTLNTIPAIYFTYSSVCTTMHKELLT